MKAERSCLKCHQATATLIRDWCRPCYMHWYRNKNSDLPGPAPAPVSMPSCGTTAAYQRHRRLQETPCEACGAAWSEYHRNRPSKKCPGDCTSCGAFSPDLRRTWCVACYFRWYRAGKVDGALPGPSRDEMREDFVWLLEQGEPVKKAAERVGICLSTAVAWERDLAGAVT